MSGSSGLSSPEEPQPWLPIKHRDKCSPKLLKASGLAWQGVFSTRTAGQGLFSIVSLNLGHTRGVMGCRSLRQAGLSGAPAAAGDRGCGAAPGVPPAASWGSLGVTVPPSTAPLSLQLGPSLQEARIAGTQLISWKIFCVKTLLLNYVFFVRVVTTFLSLVLKAKIYPLLIFVLF